MSTQWIIGLNEEEASDLSLTGGKGANLGKLTAAGFLVPPGFCVTTAAFALFTGSGEERDRLYESLKGIPPEETESLKECARKIRETFGKKPVPPEIKKAVEQAWKNSGTNSYYAVRSSATAEDLPSASFAGQQDTFLNIKGIDALMESIKKCWLSIFSDRAVIYRTRQGFDHINISTSVVVQQMVEPDTSGILFTVNPLTGHRNRLTIDAGWGLGEALVSGLITPDQYEVDKKKPEITGRSKGNQNFAIRGDQKGGTFKEPLTEKEKQVLNDREILNLAREGIKIEQHYKQPMDIEWAMADHRLYILQARPITTLFPIPGGKKIEGHIFVCFNHLQMMTDPISPAGLSFFKAFTPFRKTQGWYPKQLKNSCGRLYSDVTPLLKNTKAASVLFGFLKFTDPLIALGLKKLIERESFKKSGVKKLNLLKCLHFIAPLLFKTLKNLFFSSPHNRSEKILKTNARRTRKIEKILEKGVTGAALKELITTLSREFKKTIFRLLPFIAAGKAAPELIKKILKINDNNRNLNSLNRGFFGNITTEMDLLIGDLAAEVHKSEKLKKIFQKKNPNDILIEITKSPEGEAFSSLWSNFMKRFGMRGAGEIDIAAPRWYDHPGLLINVIRGHLKQEDSRSHRKQFAKMIREGGQAGEALVKAAGNPIKRALIRKLVKITRYYGGLREHPKYYMITLFDLVRKFIINAGNKLAAEKKLDAPNDIWFLQVDEIYELLEKKSGGYKKIIRQRKEEYAYYKTLTPPRVISGEGEIPGIQLSTENMPSGAIPGNPVSAGVVEGSARVILDPEESTLKAGEILIAPLTDPGWTPLFINAKALVMELGGLMTHGSVVAREYGIPAVAGVIDATKKIKTGQRIRVNGDAGYVEIIE